MDCSPAFGDEQDWANWWAARIGQHAESPSYLSSVHDWRNRWRPARITTLLVAESHIAELPGDSLARVRSSLLPPNVPDSFARLVQCPAYGESWLCDPVPQKNSGTWQYWDLLGHLAAGPDYKMPRANGSFDRTARLAWKIALLQDLQARGVWLVDACVVGLYAPGGERPFTGSVYNQIIRESFQRFVWPRVCNEPLHQVWTIGRSVAAALKGYAGIDQSKVISQPRDRNRTRYLADLLRMTAACNG